MSSTQGEARVYQVGFQMGDTDLCPACRHPLKAHDDGGCPVGWVFDGEGIANVEGCLCVLSIAIDQR
jgi:hypothetical protein